MELMLPDMKMRQAWPRSSEFCSQMFTAPSCFRRMVRVSAFQNATLVDVARANRPSDLRGAGKDGSKTASTQW
eukprot:scaffold16305_cov124-Isochrysis_galbana.AAC.8